MRPCTRKETAFIWAIALSAAFAFADDITIEKYPDADAVLVNCIRDAEFSPDGTSREFEETWIKVLTEKGRRDESEISIAYSSRYGSAGYFPWA